MIQDDLWEITMYTGRELRDSDSEVQPLKHINRETGRKRFNE